MRAQQPLYVYIYIYKVLYQVGLCRDGSLTMDFNYDILWAEIFVSKRNIDIIDGFWGKIPWACYFGLPGSNMFYASPKMVVKQTFRRWERQSSQRSLWNWWNHLQKINLEITWKKWWRTGNYPMGDLFFNYIPGSLTFCFDQETMHGIWWDFLTWWKVSTCNMYKKT